MFRKLIATTDTWVTVPLRLIMGALFIMHGAEKVFGVRGGTGLYRWAAMEPASSGLRPAWAWLGAAALFELIGGLLTFFGLLTRLGALMIMPVMLVAVYGGLRAAENWNFPLQRIGYPLSMLAIALALLIAGGGRASIDRTLMRRRR
ncbi:MAG TPA: DoxX family protein [Pyrinomonadaceae bacterium]|nr:DoxX family protein [Pyrinomonadaceae bacterium]